ncbi:MAG: chemotaxis protein CheW [Syntrophales bacterium]|nr:chemotaxis protein CheW [Syntrophales bacterium]
MKEGEKEKRRILRERAARLAGKEEGKRADGEARDVVEFCLASETYGLPSSSIREVYPAIDITPLPGTPAFVAGIIHVRGEILSVVDIGKFFGLEQKESPDQRMIIILDDGRMTYGILADAVMGIRRVYPGDLQSSLPTLTDRRADYLLGVTPDFLIVLDAIKILEDQRLVVDEESDVNRSGRI